MAGPGVHEFTDDNFEAEVLKSDTPVVVDFWATWCPPCRMLTPLIDQLAQKYQGKIKVGKVDVDSNQETAGAYGIQSIPTVMVFKGGTVIEKINGAPPTLAQLIGAL